MSDLLGALDRLRENILAGRFDGLPELTARIETLLPQADRLSAIDRAAIAASAQRNAAVLASAMKGMRAARRRITDLKEASSGHRTYGPSGQRTIVGHGPTSLRQRV
jgi:hypothetical protein